MLSGLRPERGTGAPLEMKGQRVCGLLGLSRERFGGGSDYELGHLRFSRICKCATGEKNPDRKKDADRVVEARGWMEFCRRPCRRQL